METPSSTYLVGLLARAMTTQFDELARAAPATPDGWWFAEPQRAPTAPGEPR